MPRIDLRAFWIFSHVVYLQNGSNSNWMDFWLLQFHVIQMRARCILPNEKWNRQTTNEESTRSNDRMIRFYTLLIWGERMQCAIINNKIAFFAAFVAFFYHGIMNRSSACTLDCGFLLLLLLFSYSVHSFNWKWSEKIKRTRRMKRWCAIE